MARNAELLSEVSFPRRLTHAVAQQKANPLKVLTGMATLSRQPNRLHPSEYFLYRPWDNRACDTSAEQTFLGADGIQRINASWISTWPELAQDKLTIYALLRGFELPIPETQAIYGSRRFLDARQLRTRDDMLRFLREEARYPLFCKPANRGSGLEQSAIVKYDRKTDELELSHGNPIGAESFVARIATASKPTDRDCCYLLQTMLRPHVELANLTCGRIGTVRLYCLAGNSGIEIIRASWKIPCGGNISDSLLHEGNLLAGIVPETGEVTHVVRPGPLEYDTVDAHPDSGISFQGMQFPEWKSICETVKQSAATVTDCLVQGWDIALAEDGPVLMELHAGGGDPMLSQLGFPTGLLEGRYAEFAKRSLAGRKRQRKSGWHEIKGNMAQQMSNLHMPRVAGEVVNASEGDDPTTEQDEEFQLDTDAKTDFSFSQRMLHAVAKHNANLVTIVADVARLSRSPNRLPPYEYFLYQLWDESRFNAEAKATFVGSDGWVRINKAMNNPWSELAEDKLALAAILRANRLAIPETQAVYHCVRSFPGADQLNSRQDVLRFLRERARYPLFGKPVGGQQSCGVVAIDEYDAESDVLRLSDRSSISVEKLVEQITVTDQDAEAFGSVQLSAGYLFQSQLRPHPELAKVVGQRTGTVRMVCISDEQGVDLIRAAWKIPAGDNVADNLWRAGNMLAGIDVETGTLTHVVKPGRLDCETVTQHPDSGVSFEGMRFPEWEAMRETVERAAASIQDCPFQGWDIALCEEGPVLVELQAGGGNPVLAQLGYSQGLLTGKYADYAERALGKSRRRK